MFDFLLTLTSLENPVNEESFLDKLFPNPWDFLATFLAFVVLLVVVFYFAYKPVKKIIQQRKDYVEGNIKEAEEANERAKLNEIESKKNIKKAKEDAVLIVSEANESAAQIVEKAKVEAKEAASKEYEKSKEALASDVEKMKDDIHKEMVDVAILASEQVIGREVNKEDETRYVDDFISSLKENSDE